jgi:hypothetical protein
MGHLQVFIVTHYLLIGLQREIDIFLFTYTGREAAMLVFIYILFEDIGSFETTILTFKLKLLFSFLVDFKINLRVI